ncbi:MAG: universal stress protein [bacterium]|nr:MAG: universal stress protein [bacterium]
MLTFDKILCPIDFSEPSMRALEIADELATTFSSVLCLVHVVSPVPTMPTPMYRTKFDVSSYHDKLKQAARETFDELIAEKISKDIRVNTMVVDGDPATEIIRILEEDIDIGVVVISTHGRTGLSRFVFGSVAEKVVRHAPCPVLTVRPGARVPDEMDDDPR